MGIAISPRGDMPKHRVPLSQARTQPCLSPTTISADKLARLIGTAETPVLIDVRTDEDFAADPRLIPGAVRRAFADVADWGGGVRRQTGRRRSASTAQKLSAGRRRLAPACRRAGRIARRRLRGWAEAGLPLVAASKAAAARRRGPHGLGDARAAEDRPHRLPLADPPLRRSAARFPLRGAVRGGRRRRALRRDAVRHRGDVFWSHRGERCTFDVMVEEFGLATEPLDRACHHRARRRHRPARPRAGGAGAARGLARPVADVCRRPRAARGRHAALRRLLPLVPRRHRRDAQLADQQGEARDATPWRNRRHGRRCRRTASRFGEAFRVWLRVAALSLRRAGRADRGDAPHPGRGEALDRRERGSCTRSTTACCCRARRRSSSRPISAG